MNDDDLASLWPHRYRPLAPGDADWPAVPDAWHALAAASEKDRLAAFLRFAEPVFRRMPKTFSYLRREAVDAYLVTTDDAGPALVVDFLDGGERISYFGFAPKARPVFAGEVGAFYAQLDGFCDLMSMGGLKPLAEIAPLGSEDFTFETAPSSTTFESLKGKGYVRVFDSGGKGFGYLDKGSAHLDEPSALVLWVDDTAPLVDPPFWDLVDNWTEIALL